MLAKIDSRPQSNSHTGQLDATIAQAGSDQAMEANFVQIAERTTHRPKPKWRNAIENLSTIWFIIVMNTGVLGILYHQQPYTFPGLQIISTVMYIFAIVLFLILAIPTIIRWTWFHNAAVRKTQGKLDEIALLGAAPIAWFELTALTALIVSNSHWGGHAFSLVAYAMWWFGMAWMVITCLGVCIDLFSHDVAHDRTMATALFLPSVGVATAAVAGSIICRYAYDLSARLAVPVLIISYFLAGLSVFISVEFYTLYFHRLMAVGWPEGKKLPSLILLVGPFGQAASALIIAGSAASTRNDFGRYMEGTFLDASAGTTVSTASTLIAMLLLGHDFFWIVVAFHGIIKGFYYREHEYSLVWWSAIFPLATTATAFISLSIAMNSPTFRVLAAIFTIFLTALYLINWVFTIRYIFAGNLLIKSDNDELGEDKIN